MTRTSSSQIKGYQKKKDAFLAIKKQTSVVVKVETKDIADKIETKELNDEIE